MAKSRGSITQRKAKKILSDGTVHGKPLTSKQKKFFGAIAGGQTPRRGTQKRGRRAPRS